MHNRHAPLIGSAAAARVFNVDRATFNRWVAAGQIPVAGQAEGPTGARLFDADVIDQLAAAKRPDIVEEQSA